jgi:hypothetical protein
MLKNTFVKKYKIFDKTHFLNKTKQVYINARNFLNKKHFIRINFNKPKFDIYSLLPLVIGMYLYTKKLSCYTANNKELDKVMNYLDKEIKNLEFKYQGKISRQPIR